MVIKEDYLVIVNAKDKIQRIKLLMEQDPVSKVFTIKRITGQYGGKETNQPELIIDKGKVKRTVSEQASLQYNSLLQNYLDKGYTRLSTVTSKKYSELSEQDIKDLLGDVVSNQSGIAKPMLAKLADQCSPDIWNHEWLCSTKIDGVRAEIYYENGKCHSASRGGKNYDPALKHILESPELLQFFKDNPNIILDGEIYKHDINWPLQRISGTARLQEWTQECENLEYWVYDYISSDSFDIRYKQLMEWKKYFTQSTKIKIIDHVRLTGYLDIKKEHDKYVQAGFEGLCARNPDKEYGINKRSALYLIKLKERKDGEFVITGVREGLRPEDMCFTLKTEDGKEFAAKPIGPIEARLEYLNNKGQFIGKKATCTYFSMSSDGIPTQPVFQHVRPDDE